MNKSQLKTYLESLSDDQNRAIIDTLLEGMDLIKESDVENESPIGDVVNDNVEPITEPTTEPSPEIINETMNFNVIEDVKGSHVDEMINVLTRLKTIIGGSENRVMDTTESWIETRLLRIYKELELIEDWFTETSESESAITEGIVPQGNVEIPEVFEAWFNENIKYLPFHNAEIKAIIQGIVNKYYKTYSQHPEYGKFEQFLTSFIRYCNLISKAFSLRYRDNAKLHMNDLKLLFAVILRANEPPMDVIKSYRDLAESLAASYDDEQTFEHVLETIRSYLGNQVYA